MAGFRNFAIERLGADSNLVSHAPPSAFFREFAAPGYPSPQASLNGLQRQNFGMKSGALHLMREVAGPDPKSVRASSRRWRRSFRARAQVTEFDLGSGIAVIAIRIDGRLREDRADMRALQNQRSSVFLSPDQMDRSGPHEVHEPDRSPCVKTVEPAANLHSRPGIPWKSDSSSCDMIAIMSLSHLMAREIQ